MVKLRLARRGRKDRAMYSIIAADVRAPRDGRFIEKLGTYNPQDNPSAVIINETSALAWLTKGAQMTETVRKLFASQGILYKRHLRAGVRKGAIGEADATKRFEKWAKETAKKKNPFMLAESSSAGQIVAAIKEKTASESKGKATKAKEAAKPAEAKVEEKPAKK
jgi:small subunit ribosomal protein S16